MISNVHVDYYIEQYKKGHILFNEERKQLIEFLENHILKMDDLFFDDDMIDNCIKYINKYYFELQPFQKFLIAFIFLFEKVGRVSSHPYDLWFEIGHDNRLMFLEYVIDKLKNNINNENNNNTVLH